MIIKNLLSIVVPMYNNEEHIQQCIKSIKAQTYRKIEVILIDDGSTDQTRIKCQDVIQDDNRFKYYKKSNGGVSSARNFGLRKSRGEYICFIDADDRVLPNFCEQLVSHIKDYEADISICGIAEVSNQTKNLTEPEELQVKAYNCKDRLIRNIFVTYGGYVCNKLYKKEIIEERSLCFDENISMCEDLLFNIEYALSVRKAAYIPSRLYEYIIRDNNASRKLDQKWFTILRAYKKALQITEAKEYANIHILISAYAIIALRGAQSHCIIMDVKFASIEKKYGLYLSDFGVKALIRIFKNKLVPFQVKTKLAAYPAYIFFRRISK